jgi:hypothetical protein
MTKDEYKQFCLDNNLRYKKDGCGDPISPSRKGLKTDQIYWTGEDELGVYAERLDTEEVYFLKEEVSRGVWSQAKPRRGHGLYIHSNQRASNQSRFLPWLC